MIYFACVNRPHSLWSNYFEEVFNYFVDVWCLMGG